MRRQLKSPALVGRQRELAALEASLTAAEGGQPSLTFVVGEGGLGKTRLTGELEQRARGRGAVVLHGECLQLSGGEFPYAPIVGALRGGDREAITKALDALPAGGGAEVARLVPELALAVAARTISGTDTSRFAQARLYELLLAMLARLGEEATVLFVIEDAHWADSASRDFLTFLVHNWTRERLALVVTLRADLPRSHPVRTLHRELKRQDWVDDVPLASRSREDLERQLDAILGRPAERDLVDDVFSRSQGNPFYAEELVAARLSGHGDGLPEDVRDTFLLRAESLPDEPLAVLRALAAVGRPAPQRLIGLLCGLPEAALSPALRLALDERLLVKRGDDDRFEFRHALMREAIVRDLMPGERVTLHRRIAEVLVDDGDANAAELAFHWEAAEQWAPALTARVQAGREAERVHALAEARHHYESAVRLWSEVGSAAPSSPDLTELLASAAEAARLAGDCDGAVDLCRRALARLDRDVDPLRAAVLHERLGAYLFWDDDAALDSYAEALRLLPDGRAAERARLLSATALTLHDKLQWTEAQQVAAQALEIAQAAGARAEEGHAHLTLGTALAFLGQGDAGELHVRQAQAIAEALGRTEDRARGFSHLAEVLRLQGRVGEALAVMEDGAATCARLGMSGSFGRSMSVNAAEDLFWLGRWDEASRRLEETARLQIGEGAGILHRYVAGQLAVARGRFEDARGHLEQARDLCDESTAPDYLAGVHVGWAELGLWQGRVDDARAELAQALRAVGDREHPLYTPALFSLAIRAAADARTIDPRGSADGLVADAERIATRLADLVARHGHERAPAQARAHGWLCRGELARLRREPAPGDWERAAEAWEALGQPYPAAYARWRQAEALISAGGHRAEATASLEAAGDTARRLDARPLSAAVEAFARAARLPLRTHTTQDARQPSAAERLGLTARELQVLPLVAEGLTNREIAETLFISPRTAAVHVSHILDKLDAENRAMAATIAHRLALVEGHVRPGARPKVPLST